MQIAKTLAFVFHAPRLALSRWKRHCDEIAAEPKGWCKICGNRCSPDRQECDGCGPNSW